ncbi:DsrE family protein [Geoalkalibacter halelectricus]|uniref:DsrE family protein n=1 Tax=Geoalkalibacter halelectricus TaxID=2847045 RepID=A0ABY5ZMH5_9BACT|nr:DsrE family protein [Geoalkalibacter halelectricus]MDO3378262.1 DsrE family protein [Geoalkalibacter halelectricus]UWZ79147.1 DsrE family protein [Geoalkalibacter halelectricus]
MKKKTGLIGLLAALVLLIAAGVTLADDKQPLLLILTSGDTQTQGMALVLSNEAQRQGAEVRVLLCSEAGKLALKEHEAPTLKPRDVSPKQMLENLMQGGAKVEVCALFLPNLGKKQEDLLEGVSAAKPPVITELLLDKQVRLLNF